MSSETLPSPEATTPTLVQLARRGDVQAFNALVSRWEPRVYNYLLRCTRNRDDALDLCQEVFLKAYRGLPRLASPARFPSWLFRIAHNEMVSSRRRQRPTADSGRLDRLLALDSVRRHDGAGFGSGSAETTFLVEQALCSLPEGQREVVLLKLHHGFKFREIADILGCPVSTVKSRLYAAVGALRKLLEPVHA